MSRLGHGRVYATLFPVSFREFTAPERAIFRRLSTPEKIQQYLDDLAYDLEPDGARCRSPRMVMRDRMAHCMS